MTYFLKNKSWRDKIDLKIKQKKNKRYFIKVELKFFFKIKKKKSFVKKTIDKNFNLKVDLKKFFF